MNVKLIEQSAEIIAGPFYEDALALTERAGRVCHRSEPKGDPEAFVRRLIGWGHESVLEHVSVSMYLVTDRAVQNELVRHRVGAAHSVESTRYCGYDAERLGSCLNVISPMSRDDPAYPDFIAGVQASADTYAKMRAAGCSPEIARSVLPLCLATRMVETYNLRELRHMLGQRLDKAAHPQMRELAGMMLSALRDAYPVFFEDIHESQGKET